MKAEEPNLNTRQFTPQEEWIRIAQEFVLANMYMRVTNNRMAPLKVVYEKMQKGLDAVKSIEELRHKTVTDAITKTIGLLEQMIHDAPWYRFRLKYQLCSKLAGARTIETIVWSIRPPEGWKIIKRPKEEAAQPVEA